MTGSLELREPLTIEVLMAEVDAKGYLCPMPQAWQAFQRYLSTWERPASGRPPIPLILAGWNFSSDADKRERLDAQIRWAQANEVLPEAARFLARLSGSDWYTGN